MARQRGVDFHTPEIGVRTGDTPQRERARFRRHPAEILITTPESLYLLLTSEAAASLRTVETVIVDEIHALVPTKRGAHLAVSLERLAARCEIAPQRIGLSATQRPPEEAARYLGGCDASAQEANSRPERPKRTPASRKAARGPATKPAARTGADTQAVSASTVASEFSQPHRVRYRPVAIVDAGARKALKAHTSRPSSRVTRTLPKAGCSYTPA